MNNHLSSSPIEEIMSDCAESEQTVLWLDRNLPRIIRRLIDSENLESPLLQLPLAQLRLANALFRERGPEGAEVPEGETMGRLSERLGVRHNALTQAADRLVNHGLAERFSDPNDRRVVWMRLTATGHEWIEARHVRRRAHLAQIWAQLDEPERAQFIQAVRFLEAIGDRFSSDIAHPPIAAANAAVGPTVEETLSHLLADAADECGKGRKTAARTPEGTPSGASNSGSYGEEG